MIDELRLLAKIAGIEVVCEVTLRDARLSKAKLDEVEERARSCNVDVVVVEPLLPPRDLLKIEKRTAKEVVDRTLVILEVFERNAGSREAKLQIEMARLRHVLPLIRERVNVAKRGEMPGFMAGGFEAPEKYYKHARRALVRLREKLRELEERRTLTVKGRRKLGAPIVAIVGFANAGKTTFFNTATGLHKEVGETPFTTLIPKSFKSHVGDGVSAVLVDTVGFVFNAPPEIIEAFKGTLNEITEADGLVLLLDASEREDIARLKLREASRILARIGASGKPLLLFLSKTDLLSEVETSELLQGVCEEAKTAMLNLVSCRHGRAFDRRAVEEALLELILHLGAGYRREEAGRVECGAVTCDTKAVKG